MQPGVVALDDEFFQQGNKFLEELASEYYASSNTGAEFHDSDKASLSEEIEPVETFKCESCGVNLMTHHLLDLHITEVHDPFFAAQAAKRLKVFKCLVEGCEKLFTSIMDRRKHLIDYHLWPSNYAFDKLHLGKKQGQYRPAEPFQRAEPGRAKHMANQKRKDQDVLGRRQDVAEINAIENLYEETPPLAERMMSQSQDVGFQDHKLRGDHMKSSVDNMRDEKMGGLAAKETRRDKVSQEKQSLDREMQEVDNLSASFSKLTTHQPKPTTSRRSRLQL